jgi:uncharacterized Zn-binding protein involved in type VI secretion
LGKPAARVGDGHDCPKVTPGTGVPHVGGVIIGPGCGTVLIEGLPAATVGDGCMCNGDPDKIIKGSNGVFIGGKPAARSGDRCAHGGVVTGGCGSVLIGEGDADEPVGDDFTEPFDEKKRKIISQVIKDCIVMLKHKHELLKKANPDTLKEFEKWFGTDDENARIKILKRIKKALNVCRKLTVDCFREIAFEENKKTDFATVYGLDPSLRIFLGEQFWALDAKGKQSKPGTLIHEISHFKKVGSTIDEAYGEDDCIELAKDYPENALNNADSFMLFIEE